MSFRGRLLLFFMIIVIVPMVAVALVLFSITADSESGKTDAQIAQGLRAAFAVYDADRARARRPSRNRRAASHRHLGHGLTELHTITAAKARRRVDPGAVDECAVA